MQQYPCANRIIHLNYNNVIAFETATDPVQQSTNVSVSHKQLRKGMIIRCIDSNMHILFRILPKLKIGYLFALYMIFALRYNLKYRILLFSWCSNVNKYRCLDTDQKIIEIGLLILSSKRHSLCIDHNRISFSRRI